MSIAIGVDVGGSHISCTAIDMVKKTMIPQSFFEGKVNNKASAEEIISTWCGTLKECISAINRNELSGVGFAMPGPFDYEKGIALFKGVEKYEKLNGVDVKKAVIEKLDLQNIQIRFMNDASSFAVGEAWIGKTEAFDRSLAITLGTGFGSAFIEGGIPIVDRDDVPEMGCVYHLPYMGGIADDSFSTRWFIKRCAEVTGKTLIGVKEIAELAQTEEAIKDIFIEFGRNLADFLSPWLKKFGAEGLVIGGNISGAYKLFGSALKQGLKGQGLAIQVSISELKESATFIGSARLLDESFWTRIKPVIPFM